MGAAWYRARGELRHRWRQTVLLVALVGLAGGVVLTTVAGARRSSTAYDRFRQETLSADLDIAFDGPPSDDAASASTAIAALPQVAALTQSAYPFIVPAGSGFYPYLDFLAVVGLDDAFGVTIDRPRLLDGRLPRPDRADEIAVLDSFASEADIDVGDRVEFESYAPEQLEPLFTTGDAGAPSGPRVSLVVTGVVDAPIFVSESTGSFQAKVVLSRAFVGEHGDQVATYPGGFAVRLHGGAADIPAVSAAVREMFVDAFGLELTPAAELTNKIDDSVDVIVAALVLFALVAGIAGCVAVAQGLSRHFARDVDDAPGLRALGMTRRERVVAGAVTAFPIAVGGAAAAAVVAVAASPLMPVGIARRAEPNLGLSIDGVVLTGGFVAVTLTVALLAVVAAAAVGRRPAPSTDIAPGRRPSGAMRALRRTSLRPPTTIGVGMALEPGAGTAWPVRSALASVAFGTAGLIAVVVFAASLTTLVESPARFGAPWDGLVSGFTGDVIGETGSELLADPDVERLGLVVTGLGRIGDDELNLHALHSLKGDATFTLLDGRWPVEPGEVALGSETMRRVDVELGDTVAIIGAAGTVQATIVARSAFPIIDERSSAGRGALLLEDELSEIAASDELNHDLIVKWSSGVDAGVANEALAERTDTAVFAPRLPADVNNLRDVEELPRVLAACLALLATLATIHALISTVRARRREIAVLRTLGLERQQLTATVAWQATTIAVIGLVAGIPLGLVVGRLVWRAVASSIGVAGDPATPLLPLGVITLGAVVVANLAAVLPARLAGRVRPAATLRTP